MIRKLNFTGRRKIERKHIQVTIKNDGEFMSYDTTLNLSEYDFPRDCKVYVEAYLNSAVMRFDHGTVSELKIPEDRKLKILPTTELTLFRIKVVDEATEKNGLIVGLAEAVSPIGVGKNPEKQSILHVDYNDDLEETIFKVSFEGVIPSIKINKRIENGRELVLSDSRFRSLVFPSVVRQIASRLLSTLDDFNEGDGSWQDKWLSYIRNVLGVWNELDDELDSVEEIERLADDACDAYCRIQGWRSKLMNT
jgi:hypothetical protein